MTKHGNKQPPMAARSRIGRGDVIVENEDVPGSPTPRVIAWAVIEAPVDRVWPLLDDVPAYPRNIAGVKSARLISREGTTVTARVTIGMPFPLKDLTATTRAEHVTHDDGVCTRSWTLVEGDYKRNSGQWTLEPFDGADDRTLLTYELHVEPNIRVPKKLQNMAQKKALPKMFKQLRERVAGR